MLPLFYFPLKGKKIGLDCAKQGCLAQLQCNANDQDILHLKATLFSMIETNPGWYNWVV